MKRPPKDVVAKAIEESSGVLTRVAATLDCSRPTLYKWIWQYSLQRLAGLDSGSNGDSEASVDRQHCKHEPNVKYEKKYVKFSGGERPTFGSMSTTQPTEGLRMQRSVKLTDAQWAWARKRAIDEGCSASDLVERALDLYRKRLGVAEERSQ
jgi:transposase-like protein